MTLWLNKLDLKDLWKAKRDGELTIQQMAREIAKRIRAIRCYKKHKEELEEMVYCFENCSDDVEEFDSCLGELYDWGDQSDFMPHRKLCWIATF